MLGAIIGDIVGSRFERNNYRSKDFDLFGGGCSVTDDSIMTLAIAKALMEASKAKPKDDFNMVLYALVVKYMQEIGRKYPNCGFGGRFRRWVFSDDPKPYNSFGNGSAMRVSPIGFFASSKWEADSLAEIVSEVTHNHKEGIKGAKATAVAITMARHGALKSEIKECITSMYYPLDFQIDDIRPAYKFSATCQETVPQALECFLESTSFEDAIRTAISLGGDSDTIAAITGAVAEAYYGIPEDIKEKALSYLDDDLRATYDEWVLFVTPSDEKFHVLTKYIGKMSSADSIADRDSDSDEIMERPTRFLVVEDKDLYPSFEKDIYSFIHSNPKYKLTRYGEILERHGLHWNDSSICSEVLQTLDEQCVLALITAAVRADDFCGGVLIEIVEDGRLVNWLKRLKDIDWQRSKREVTEIILEDGGYFGGLQTYQLSFNGDGAELSKTSIIDESTTATKNVYSQQEAKDLREKFADIHTEYWSTRYVDNDVLDGEQWGLTVRYSNGNSQDCSGSNAFPKNWDDLLEFLGLNARMKRKIIMMKYKIAERSEDTTVYKYMPDDEQVYGLVSIVLKDAKQGY